MTDVGLEQEAAVHDPLIDRAKRLFEFLARAQQLKSQPPRTVDAYRRDGAVLWLADLPQHPAVTAAHRGDDPEPDDALLSIDRVPRLDAPVPDDTLAEWLTGPVDDPGQPPELPEAAAAQPSVYERYIQWLTRWRPWADRELLDRPVRTLYGELFSAYVTASGNPEELELVAGIGCLAWTPPGHPAVKRHLLTAPVAINFDDDTGRLTVTRVESVDAVEVELDMLDPGLVSNPAHVSEVRAQARALEAHPLRRKEIGSLVRRIVHTLDADGEYRDADEAPDLSPRAVAAFAPAVILRRRSQRGLVEIFQTIVNQLTETGEVPDGVLPLVDADHRPRAEHEDTSGALVMVDDDPFLPLPVNDVQLRIIRQVDTKAQTLVQGPPGTGKTHTAAALLSHLLAQGKRVLVTSHTDRALKEVRDKLPAAIKPLSVAVVGTSREDMSDLKVAVERIAATATEHDPQAAERTVLDCLDAIESLRRRRSELHHQLVSAREHEVREHEHAGYHGTLAAIAWQLRADAARFGWLREHTTAASGAGAPLDDSEIAEWHGLLLDADLAADEPESRQRLVELATVPDPRTFADLVAMERAAAGQEARHEALRGHAAFDAVRRIEPTARTELRRRLHQLTEEADDLARRREPWMNEALADVCSGRARIWQARGAQISALIGRSSALVGQLGPLTEVEVSDGNVSALLPPAAALYAHLRDGGTLKTTSDGSPKIGALAPKAVKQAQPVFDRVRVDGLPPTTVGQLGAFLTWAEASKNLAALDRAWPEGVRVPTEDTLNERLQWHITELEQLHRLLRLGEALDGEQRRLAQLRLPRPDWTDLDAVRTYADLVDAAGAADASHAATEPLRHLEETLAEAAGWGWASDPAARRAEGAGTMLSDAAPCVHLMLRAVHRREHDEYAAAHRRVERLGEVRRIVERRDDLAARLSAAAPGLRAAIEQSAADPLWAKRLTGFTLAWAWASTGTWVLEQGGADINALQAEIGLTEERIRREVETLAATRAWSHAVSADRLTGQARANLEHYAYLVRRLGKGTGRYAAQRRAEIRTAMDRCRPAVPVWIMPIYRIAEQLQIHRDMFDVVIVDEASQAGLEATFLQYLAPKMVVIGDDRQVSPTAVGIDQQQLRDLAGQYLADDPYRAAWQDPQRSLFDEAKMRYRGLLTLTEHRRCVPEIIGFSNRIAYEPDGIRLIPVRQYGADRLEPIVTVHLPDGHVRGSTSKINPVEVAAVVEAIEKCIADPRYDGLTFGVISLLGPAQAKAIEKALLDRVTPEDWAARKLQCGDSADFQGAERDVMFLSMVAAPEPGERVSALTSDVFVQRYNVAASRAKDQMWLFHSVSTADLGNPEDMRFQLLDHCYGVINRRRDGSESGVVGPVPDDILVDPFNSLFEQRVATVLLDRGYTVIPRYSVDPHRLDLVVVGAKSRLAVECDGDTWLGPEAYERELASQRDLERCGWQFFRIRESAFYVDGPAVLDELLATLRELDIHPAEAEPEPAEEVVLLEPEPPPAPVVVVAPAVVPVIEPGATPAIAPAVEPVVAPVVAPVVVPAPVGDATLAPYQEFTGTLPAVLVATRRALVDGVRGIVAAEGPVTGHRVHSAYLRASGDQRLGRLIANALNSAISSAVHYGLIVEDNPLSEPGVKPRTYRLPDQPPVLVRALGPRPFDHIPPRELAAIITRAAEHTGWDSEESLYRATLTHLGLRRPTTPTHDRFTTVLPLTQPNAAG